MVRTLPDLLLSTPVSPRLVSSGVLAGECGTEQTETSTHRALVPSSLRPYALKRIRSTATRTARKRTVLAAAQLQGNSHLATEESGPRR
ncbi:MAG: hypothetical protein PWR07_2092 [Bacillota bacterium]|nr:hypothetical protein [Bacillota bacterium]